jgi:ADP-ribose pyrophosphatase
MLFWALADTEGVGGVHGLDHEHEDIRVHVMEFAEAIRAVREGRIRSATGLVALQWLALNRERLRNEH